MKMDNTKKVRAVERRHFTKAAKTLESLLEQYKTDPNKFEDEARACHSVVRDIFKRLEVLDEEIRTLLIGSEDWDEKQLETELSESGQYKAKWVLLDGIFEKLSKPTTMSRPKTFKLPQLEIKKFDGDIKNWLAFWGQYKKIDADTAIDDIDKLQYLAQSIEAGTEVRNFIESFPLTKDSYKTCLEELKNRYAREDLLIQIYVRELLTLILTKDLHFELTKLYDNVNSHLRALEILGVTKDKYAAFLLPMVESALPTELLKTWERLKPAGNREELNSLLEFLKKEVESNQRIKLASDFHINKTKEASSSKMEPTAACLNANVQQKNSKELHIGIKCIWCDKESHPSVSCYKIAKMTIDERREVIKKKKACTLCLKIGHHAKICRTHIKCYVCGQKHSPVLCPGNLSVYKQNSEKKNENSTIQNYSSQENTQKSTTILQTVAVKIENENKSCTVRALFDSGSQRSYIRKEVTEKMGIKPAGTEELSHTLFGGVQVSFQKYDSYNFSVKSIDNSFNFEMTALGQNIICKNVPKVDESNKSLSELLVKNKIKLADHHESNDISLLIGADFLGLLLTNKFVQLGNGLTAIETKLGWTLQGKTNNIIVHNNMVTSLFVFQNVSDFWNLELIGIRDPVHVQSKQQIEEQVMMNFEESIQVDDDGRYQVSLPWKTGHDDLLDNREVAQRRLLSATNKLVTCGKFQDYDKIFKEWESTGIIEPVPTPQKAGNNVHYLPHRAVSKEASLTTKLRPVFDASAKDKNGKSLNACLDKGINFLDKIPELLIGFRKGTIGVTADITKAFLQISVRPDDREYLRFLWWRDNARQEVMEYRHCRVVFGLTSSPFLLSATIMHHLDSIKGEQKNTANIMKSSFYVDNLVTSLDTEKQTHDFVTEAKDIMQSAKFELRQWVTSPMKINETGQDTILVLGLLWDTVKDELYCNLKALLQPQEINNFTKRLLLSLTQSFFDPIGILCPVTLIPRLLLQEVWNRKIMWDDELPNDIKKRFLDWYENISYLDNCRLPRRLSADRLQDCDTSLHMFCDASKDGYAACVFLRAEYKGNVTVRLLSAKSRISPPEKITIPRLELLAALIGSRLIKAARDRLRLGSKCKEYCWCDSGVALCWIKRELMWNTYVGNRVREIRNNTDISTWYHIPGTDNWADLASRGCDARQLWETRWWCGPPWLLRPPADWPRSQLVVDEKEVHKELRKIAVCNTCNAEADGMLPRIDYFFSKYTKIVRMTAWLLRFIYNTKNKNNKKVGELTYEECEEAEKKIIKMIQIEYKEVIEKHTEKLVKFYDKDNLLRIKTKLLLTNFPDNFKTPTVIPASSAIVRRMVEQRHLELYHAGTNMLIADLRKQYWIIGVRKLVKAMIDKCMICKRHRTKATQVTGAPLPIERIQSNAPFEITGVDLAGPLYLQGGDKCWIVIFTCAVYRAVHLELTLSLSTDAFIKSLRRFIARRGRVQLIITDNGTNFTGAKNLLDNIDWNEVQRRSTILRIKWKLNAPTAAWWGGFFERMIKIVKNLLRRVLGTATVTHEEMQTILCDCEAVVNDRPLTYVVGDNTDGLEPLTPSCFLHTLPQSQVNDLDLIDATSLNRRLRYMQKLRDDFRERFKNEYLTELVQKGREKGESLKIGDVVLVESEEKRVKWPLGLIVDIYKGKDGVNRTAKVKTSSGYKTRPFQRLYKLELSFSEVERRQDQESTPVCNNNLGKQFKIIINPSSTAIEKEAIEVMGDKQKTTRLGRVVRLPSKYKI